MNLKRKLGIAAAALAISGGLLTGAAFAYDDPSTPAPQAQTEGSSNPLSEAAKSLMTQLQELRQKYMDQYKADAQSLVDSAVQNGSLTQEEADKLLAHGGKGFGGRGHGGFGMERQPLTQEELKAKLDEAVAAGKLTQEQADQILANGGQGFGGKGFGGGHGRGGKGGFSTEQGTDGSNI